MSNHNVVTNLNLQGLARHHKEHLGAILLTKCHTVQVNVRGDQPVVLLLADGGSRIRALVDAGADLNMRSTNDSSSGSGSTALMMLIQSGIIDLVKYLFYAGASVSVLNDEGATSVELLRKCIASSSWIGHGGGGSKKEWSAMLKEMQSKDVQEREALEAKERTRQQNNEAHRQQQHTLRQDARTRAQEGRNGSLSNGLGRLEEGYCYFPSLSTLQFQEAVPPPSASVAQEETKIKERLRFALNCMGALIFLFFILN